MSVALSSLDTATEALAAEDAAAADAAKLDAEAEALRDAAHAFGSWCDLDEQTKNHWRAVARKAREIHGGKQ